MLPVAVSVLLLAAAFGEAASPPEDKRYVVDGALALAKRSLLGKQYSLPPVSETISQRFGVIDILFTFVLTPGNLQVEEMSRQGEVAYNELMSKFQYRVLLRTRVDSNYKLYGGGTCVSSGKAVIHWDSEFNGTFVTNSCNLQMESTPLLETNIFHIDMFSENMNMNISYNDNPFSSIINVFKQKVTVLVKRSLSEIPICHAIQC